MELSLTRTCSFAQGLRDFFSARSHEALNFSWNMLAKEYGKETEYLNTVKLEYEFNRLFVGPDKVPAPPYASVYLDDEPLLMGKSTLEMRGLIRSLDLAVPEGGEPDDFIAYELEIWLILVLCLKKENNEENRQNIREAIDWLVREHMALWIPQFLKKAYGASVSEEINLVLNALQDWMQSSLERSLYEKI